MNENRPFIGMGNNPQGPDLPLGLSMRLAHEPDAINGFGNLSDERKTKLIGYIKDSGTGIEAQTHIERAIEALKMGRGPEALR